jgi:hypothetical protein
MVAGEEPAQIVCAAEIVLLVIEGWHISRTELLADWQVLFRPL